MKSKRLIILLLAFMVGLMSACAQGSGQEPVEQTHKRHEFKSQIQKADCYLCSDTSNSTIAEYRGQANIGLVNVNTFDVMRLEINRYDRDGDQILEATGAMRLYSETLGGIRVTGMVDPDRSFASVNFDPEGAVIDEDRIGLFLCQDCLDEFATACYGGDAVSPIAVVGFTDRFLVPLKEVTPWFARRDYIVTVNFDEDGSIGVVVIYSPPRFQNEEQAVDGAVTAN